MNNQDLDKAFETVESDDLGSQSPEAIRDAVSTISSAGDYVQSDDTKREGCAIMIIMMVILVLERILNA